MAQQRTFEIQIADGVTVTLTTSVPGTLEVIFPDFMRDAFDAIGAPPLDPVELQKNYTIPITIDNPFQPKDLDYDPLPAEEQSHVRRHHVCQPDIPQPTRHELKTMLETNNITPLDHAYKPNSSSVPSTFNPYTALVDYEDCMRTWSKPDIFADEDAEVIEEPMVWGDQITDLSVNEIVALLPDESPQGLAWGYTPFASVNYPLFALHVGGDREHLSSKDVTKLLKAHPYLGCPNPPKGREHPVPGVILHRLHAIGWITDEEAKERWLDIDWFSLRDYRDHLAKKRRAGNGDEEFYVVKRRSQRSAVFDGTMKTREKIWREQKNSVECKRIDLELEILMREGRNRLAAEAWYERHGFAYVTAPPTGAQSDSAEDAGYDETKGCEITSSTSPTSPSPSSSPSPMRAEALELRLPSYPSLTASSGTSSTPGNLDPLGFDDSTSKAEFHDGRTEVAQESDVTSGLEMDIDTDTPLLFRTPAQQVPPLLALFPISGKRKISDSDNEGDDEEHLPSQKKRKIFSPPSCPSPSPISPRTTSPSATPRTPQRHGRAPLPRTPRTQIPATPLMRTVPLPAVDDGRFLVTPSSLPTSVTPQAPLRPGVRIMRHIDEDLRRGPQRQDVDLVSPTPTRPSVSLSTSALPTLAPALRRSTRSRKPPSSRSKSPYRTAPEGSDRIQRVVGSQTNKNKTKEKRTGRVSV
ncbi:hypothetical protein V5O48_013959 [Marasmius crinis-equi]|uniref:Uncharacterized protein n=1 Tax=Marasmius crinis-equi TaxID=585013 RepID=A0ABR3EYP2_9AGAR